MGGGGFLDYVDPWINWTWLTTHVPVFLDALQQHITLTLIAVGVGLLIALPAGVLAQRRRALRNPMLTVFGRRGGTMHFAMIERSYPSTDKMHGGKNRGGDEVDDAEYLYPRRYGRCRCAAGIHAGIAGRLVM